MLRFTVEAGDVAATRFAVSPVFELAKLVEGLVADPDARGARRFRAAFDALRADPAVQAFAYLEGPRYAASFAAPPPSGMAQTIDDDLAALRRVEAAQIAPELDEIRALRRPSPVVAALLVRDDLIEQLAGGIERAWSALLAPDWPRVRAVLERDVRFRAERLAEAGWAAAIDGMHERLAWRDGGIEVQNRDEHTEALAGRGLLLVPSVFAGTHLAVYREEPWQRAIVYPARGAGLVFEEAGAPTDPLAPLLGRTRAGLLLALATPSSTTQLAAVTGGSIGATGDHLKVLLDAGLLTRARIGRSVVYRRSDLGDALATVT